MKKICLITPGHIASNPRLVKDTKSLIQAGYHVHIIFTQYMPYLVEHDTKILNDLGNCTYKYLNWVEKSYRKLFSGLVQKTANFISCKFFKSPKLNAIAINRNYNWQLNEAVKTKADLYIAHNLGALPVAVEAAKINKVKCGFDAEDFHRFEECNDLNNTNVRLKIAIEDYFIPQVNYLTAASPLIAQAYQELYPLLNPVVINNVFEIKHQKSLVLNSSKNLKLFWFSQTIGKNRGLETVIEALNLLNNSSIELHLLGNLNNENKTYFDSLAQFNINYIPPIEPDKIFEIAATMDIGLALEPGFCLNNEFALSNKLFTYLIVGNAILASETQAQKLFMNEHYKIGLTFPIGDVNSLINHINFYLNNKTILNTHREQAWLLAKGKFNWESEQEKFIQVINLIL